MLNTEATIGWRARRNGRGQALRLPVLHPRPGGCDRGPHPDRGSRAATDGRLWPLEACGGTGPRGARPGLGRACASSSSTAPA
jgi:hypothetical protein